MMLGLLWYSLALVPPLAVGSVPRTEVHIHWDGSVTMSTLLEAARARDLSLPVIGRREATRSGCSMMNLIVDGAAEGGLAA